MADRTGDRPSKATKDRLTRLVEQDIIECGKVAKHLCQRSGSREVRVALFRESLYSYWGLLQMLLKSAKKTAAQEGTMENTLNVSGAPVAPNALH